MWVAGMPATRAWVACCTEACFGRQHPQFAAHHVTAFTLRHSCVPGASLESAPRLIVFSAARHCGPCGRPPQSRVSAPMCVSVARYSRIPATLRRERYRVFDTSILFAVTYVVGLSIKLAELACAPGRARERSLTTLAVSRRFGEPSNSPAHRVPVSGRSRST
jgi:hypothetical protein